MKILVICNNGNSSSVMAQKINKEFKSTGYDGIADAIPPFDAKAVINQYDVVLIAPQIKHDLKVYQKLHDKVALMNTLMFGMLDAKKAIKLAEETIGK